MAEYRPKGSFSDTILSDDDRERIRKLSEVYEKAAASGDTGTAQIAHEAAEHIRAQYGYSGGEDGSEYIKLENKNAASLADQLAALYGAKTDERVASLERAYDDAKRANDAAKEQVRPDYDALRNRASAENEIEKRNFAERAAASGMNHGTSSQAELSRSVAYQNALAQISAAEASELADLNRQAEKLDTEHRLAVAEAVSDGEYELAGKLYDEGVRQAREAASAEAEAKKAAQQEQERQYDIAELAAKYGDYSLLRALGIDAQEQKKTSSGSSRSGSSKTGGSSTGSGSKDTPEELFELMLENSPNEYVYLTINREAWNIPANQIDDVWLEYAEWRTKKLKDSVAVPALIAGTAGMKR